MIYYRRVSEGEIWLITVYAKNEASIISPQILRKIAEGDLSNFGDTTTLLNPEIVDEIVNGKL